MPNRPDPTPIPDLDRKGLRRDMKLLLPVELILDEQEWDELLDFSGQTARHNVIRKNLIAARRAGGQVPRTLAPAERLALGLFVLGDGPLPAFLVPFVVPPRAPEPGPVEDPTEPGRYVQPTGRFAVPASPEFQPDTR